MSFLDIIGITFVIVHVCYATDICHVNGGLEFCDYGCCTNSCCGMTTIAIVGIVIGCSLALIGIIGCIVCLACMCKHAKTNRTTTPVHPVHNTNSVYINNMPYHPPPNQTSNFSSQPVPPPSYNQYNSYPASSNFEDAAYPPGYAHPPPTYQK